MQEQTLKAVVAGLPPGHVARAEYQELIELEKIAREQAEELEMEMEEMRPELEDARSGEYPRRLAAALCKALGHGRTGEREAGDPVWRCRSDECRQRDAAIRAHDPNLDFAILARAEGV